MKGKIKYYLLLLAFLFIMALILWFFHDWIEQYSNSLMVLITFIYVVATIEICRANIKSAEATKEQLEESRSQFEEAKRLECMPFLQLEIPTEQERPLFEIELDLCSGNVSDTLYKIVKLKNLGNGSATNIVYTWKRNKTCDQVCDYPPINAIMHGDSYYFQLTFYTDETMESGNTGTLIWQYDDLLGNTYEQKVTLIFDEGDLIRCENDTPKYLGVIVYKLADKAVSAKASDEEKTYA